VIGFEKYGSIIIIYLKYRWKLFFSGGIHCRHTVNAYYKDINRYIFKFFFFIYSYTYSDSHLIVFLLSMAFFSFVYIDCFSRRISLSSVAIVAKTFFFLFCFFHFIINIIIYYPCDSLEEIKERSNLLKRLIMNRFIFMT
jgi:hypothetical protein